MHDWQLLRDYVEHNSQTAFAALVERHANMVYSTCLRETGDAMLAEDVAQVVFLILARKADSLREGTVLTGWLFQTARFASKNAMKQEQRRKRSEQKAAEQMMSESEANPGWASIEPLLHDGLATLGGQERDAVLLRFFENRSLRETGAALGISEDAARMRVARALEKLRRHFARHGFAASVALLAALLSENAVHAAPASCLSGAARLTSQTTLHSGAPGSVLSAKAASLSHEVLRAMLFKKLGVAAGLGVLLIASGAALSHVITRAATRNAPVSARRVAAKPIVAKRNAEARSITKVAVAPSIKPMPPVTLVKAPTPVIAATRAAPEKPPARLEALPKVPFIAPTQRRPLRVEFAPAAPVRTTVSSRISAPQAIKVLPVTRELHSTARVAKPIEPAVALAPKPSEAVSTEASPEPIVADSGPTMVSQAVMPESVALKTRPTKQAKIRRRNAAKAFDLRGRVLSINESAASISLRQPNANEKTVTIPTAARIFVDNQAANLEDIKVGMTAKIRLEEGQDVLAIHAHTPLKRAAQWRTPRQKPKEAKKKSNKVPISTP